MKISAE